MLSVDCIPWTDQWLDGQDDGSCGLEDLITSGVVCTFYYRGCSKHAFSPLWLTEVVRGWYCSYILKHISFQNNLDFYFCLKNHDLYQP